jgi:hypothetical protein
VVPLSGYGHTAETKRSRTRTRRNFIVFFTPTPRRTNKYGSKGNGRHHENIHVGLLLPPRHFLVLVVLFILTSSRSSKKK